LFLGDIFETETPIKSSKDSDCSLVSNKNLSQKIPPSGWRPGPGNLSQNGLKPIQLMTSPTKQTMSKTFQFFSLQSQRISASFSVWTAL